MGQLESDTGSDVDANSAIDNDDPGTEVDTITSNKTPPKNNKESMTGTTRATAKAVGKRPVRTRLMQHTKQKMSSRNRSKKSTKQKMSSRCSSKKPTRQKISFKEKSKRRTQQKMSARSKNKGSMKEDILTELRQSS